MKTRTARTGRTDICPARWERSSCSLVALAGAGALTLALPYNVLAQSVRPAIANNALPVLRSVVSGQAQVNGPAPGAASSLMTVNQASQRAILDWRQFNIGRDSEVRFVQPNSTASALNRIYDANPSVIQGKLTANGQVLLINQNGILFDRGAQVNTQSLVASTLNISNEKFLSGVLTGGGLNTPAFEGGYDEAGTTLLVRPDGQPMVTGSVTLGGGAADAAPPQLRAAASGSIMIFAPHVNNASGIIAAPDGQVILAAGAKAYLALNADENDITLRGFRVEVQAAADGPGVNLSNLVRNAGQISADRGNVSLAGLAINQEGRISAKTAVQSNGSIFLKASTLANERSGSVTFAAGSVTEVAPDAADKATMPDSQAYQPYRGVITVSGKTIESHGVLRAAGGQLNLQAGDAAAPETARIYLGAGSETSVAGTWADVDYQKNLQTFRVTSNELKNSPDQKNGILRGATVTVDLRENNNILSLDGYRAIVPRTVVEKAAAGGELLLTSTGSVIQRNDAVIDASGGGYRYNSGYVTTSKLLGTDAKIYDIATAPQLQGYATVLDRFDRVDTRWGQSVSLANPLGTIGSQQPAYVQGLAGGAVTISSRAGLVLDGTLRGGVTIGDRQLANAPRGASLSIGRFESAINAPEASQRIGNIEWAQQARDTLGTEFNAGSALSALQRDTVNLAAGQLFGEARQSAEGRVEQSFGSVELNSNGRIVVPAGVQLQGDVGAQLILRAPQVEVGGSLNLPSGNLTIQPTLPGANEVDAALGGQGTERVLVRAGAELSTAGSWINNSASDGSFVGAPLPSGRSNAQGSGTQLAVDGGSISIQFTDQNFQTRLERGAVLDVGGGASVDSRGRIVAGKGGKLAIANGTFNQASPDWLQSQAGLRGFAPGAGGELTLNLARAQITNGDAIGVLSANTTRLSTGLFASQGFSKVTINATEGIDIIDGTQLVLQQKNLVVDRLGAPGLATGGDLATVSSPQTLPDSQRGAASLALNARAGNLGTSTLHLGQGAAIQADPRADITLSAVDGMTIDGRITAPGGRVNLSVNGRIDQSAGDLQLGSSAVISTGGTFVGTPNDLGLVQGTLVDGGSVTLDARISGVRAAAGSLIDVSAVSRTVDVLASGNNPGLEKRVLDGQAGSLIVKSNSTVALDGELRAHAGSQQVAGGSFALELRRPDGQEALPAQRRVVVTPGGDGVAAQADVVDAKVNVAALRAAGFEKLRLQSENRIEFQGSSQLDFERGIRLDAPLIDVAGNSNVTLKGSTVSIGQSMVDRQLQGAERPSWELVGGTAVPPVATRRGDGTLSVDAGAVDLYGSFTINGSRETQVASQSDIRMIGQPISVPTDSIVTTRQVGALTTAGNLELRAAQVYPATRTDFTVAIKSQPDNALIERGLLRIASNGAAPGTAYSAAGKVTLEAHSIVQDGVLKAPLGEITLRAGENLRLGAGSLTSVSGAGATVLYGTTLAGVTWQYGEGGVAQTPTLTTVSPGGKRIELSAPGVDISAGATVDLRGGGKVLAVEFVGGNGGDTDITLRDNTFAIIPAARLAAMPFDSHTQGLNEAGIGFALANGRDTALYDSVKIGSGAMVPAGEYVLLPARFALLPDAYLVEVQTGAAYRNLQPGQTVALGNGSTLVAGFRSARGTNIQASQSVGLVISPGAAVRRFSDYNLSGAELFANAAEVNRERAPRSPWDAGRLAIDGAAQLTLDGRFETEAGVSSPNVVGRAAEIDIGGAHIALVERVGDPAVGAEFVQLEAASLSRLGGSVLIGGTRSDTESGIRISTSATDLLVANSQASALRLPELMLAATERIDIRSGSVLEASGSLRGAAPGVLTTESSGALVRLSSRAQTRVDRGVAGNQAGDVRIESGARLNAQTSLLVDATRSTESSGQLRAGNADGAGGSVSLASTQVNLGNTSAAGQPPSGLVLSNADLAAYGALDELVLRGYGAIELLGTTTLGTSSLGRLTLDTPALRGRAAADGSAPQATLAAREISLANNSAVVAQVSSGTGALTLQADRIVLGAGQKAVDGFATAQLTARDNVSTQGVGALRVAAALTLETPRLVASGGSNQTVSAYDPASGATPGFAGMNLMRAGTSAAVGATPAGELGGRLTLEGKRVDIATAVVAHSGQISVVAHGGDAGDAITLSQGALLDVRGEAKDFNGTLAIADGGSVSLAAQGGAVAVQVGARVDVSAAAQGGNAGRLALRAATIDLGGDLSGRAGADARSGSIDIDAGSLPAFSALNAALNAGQFAEERNVRLRMGDIEISALDTVAARRIGISADSGRIGVAGTLGTGAAKGGARINLYSEGDIDLRAGSRVVANGIQPGARGGEVRVASRTGGVSFDAAAEIDVRAGDAGPPGSVVFGVSRDANNVLAATRLEGTVRRWSAAGRDAQSAGVSGDAPARVAVEATRTYDVSGNAAGVAAVDIAAGDIAGFAADHEAFVSTVNAQVVTGALRDESGPLSGARVLGSLELRSGGDLVLPAVWDLTTAQWLAGNQPGTLTLRAGGKLTVREALGLPNDNIRSGDTWSLRLAAGADLSAADPLATRSTGLPEGDGALALSGARAKLRTGTGRIDLASAGNMTIDDVAAAIYTAGRTGAADADPAGNNRWAVAGGGISVRVGGSLTGATTAAGYLWVNEWLRRPRQANNVFGVLQPTEWWTYRPRFQQGIGTLAGGDIDIDVAGSLSHLTAALPTSGRVYRDTAGARQVDVQGGGDLNIRVGQDVIGSAFLIGRGEGRVDAGGDIGVERRAQLYLMGVSSGAAPEGATMSLVAGGSVRLQSVNNPTSMFQTVKDNNDPATGPSFNNAGNFSTFFTYSPNSKAAIFAKDGDLSYQGDLPTVWRTFNRIPPITATTTQPALPGAFPASLEFVAFDGDIAGSRIVDAINTFPSTTARVALLAGGSLFDVGMYVSDRDPSTVVTPTTSAALANVAARQISGTAGLRPNANQGRIVERAVDAPFAFELQALNGDIVLTRGGDTPIVLTAASRVRAGVDIVGPRFVLQNLAPGDLSEIRADSGDIRSLAGVEIRGPGRLLVQAGRNIDLGDATVVLGSSDVGGLVATANSGNSRIPFQQSARITVVAGVNRAVDLSQMEATYRDVVALNQASNDIIDLYRQLGTEPDAETVLGAGSIAALALRDAAYARFVSLDTNAPRALAAYKTALRAGTVPLGPTRDSADAVALYRLLNLEIDVSKLTAAGTVAALADAPGGEAYRAYVDLDRRFPILFADYLQRRGKGSLPSGVTPIVFSSALADAVAQVVGPANVSGGDITSFRTSIQTIGGSDIDLWAPAGDIVVGLTTPSAAKTVGVLTNAGGAIRSVLAGDFNINQGKVITAQGGDILLFSSGGSIDAGRGAKTSIATPPPVRRPILDASGNQIGVEVVISSAATGSGIQTLTSDPDGLGPLGAPKSGDVYLFAPAGTIDAGEAGIRSSGNIVIAAQTVLNASNISASGSSAGVPVAVSGSLASSVATSGGNTASGSKAAEDASNAATNAAKAAASAVVAKPSILTVEVLGFGEKNCKEQDKDCFAK